MQGPVGPFRILEPLGRGGMGMVWRAEDGRTGQIVALKTVREPRAGMLASIRREIHALAQLRHPGIVRILDEGVQDGMPWYAMEMLSGMTLRQWKAGVSSSMGGNSTDARRAGSSTQALDISEISEPSVTTSHEASAASAFEPTTAAALHAVLVLVRRLCFALSYLHGEGIVHRDLKPDNILVRPDGQPVIVDFGLVSRSFADDRREALDVAGDVSGTMAYMAPEQCRGELVDARADLYALGCLLYQLIAGRPPFIGKTPIQVLYQHLKTTPPPLSAHAPWIPPALDRLISRLLEKEPRARFGYADDVSAALAGLGIDVEPSDKTAARSYLYRPGFSGRQDAIMRLRERLDALQAGKGGLMFIGGETGVGKTRLLVELSHMASKNSLRVLTGECLPPAAGGESGSGSAPLQAFRKFLQVVTDRCRERGENETEQLLGSRVRVLAAYEASFAELPGVSAHAPPPELPPKDARQRVYQCLIEALVALSLAEDEPVLLLLDDLQWADELSLGALEAMQRGGLSEELPLLVVVGYRTEECSSALHKLAQEADLLKLERLNASAVERIVMDMLGLSSPPETFARFLLQQSEGNPFFVAEYLRAALGQKLLYRDGAGFWQVAGPDNEKATEQTYAALPLPRSLLELVSGRLARLGLEAQQLAFALSVLGREADSALVAAVSGLSSADVMKATLETLGRQVIEATDDVETQNAPSLRFVHDKLREVAYGRLDAEQKRSLHLQAAKAMEEAYVDKKNEVLGVLALHWEQGGEPEKARPYYVEAARQAQFRYAHAQAEQFYRAYLRLATALTPDDIQVRVQMVAHVLQVQGRMQEAFIESQLALDEARRLGHKPSETLCLRSQGVLYHMTGRLDQARELYEASLALAREIGDPLAECMVLCNLGGLHHHQGRLPETHSLYEQALVLARQTGYRVAEGNLLGNLAVLAQDDGQVDRALQLYSQTLALRRELGDRRAEGRALGNCGILHLGQGRLAQAEALLEEALEIAKSVGDRPGEGVWLVLRTRLFRRQGHTDKALLSLAAADALLKEIGDRQHQALALCERAHLELAEGRTGASLLASAREMAAALHAGARSDLGQALVRLESAQAAFEAGEHERLLHGEIP